ncbi:MAG: ABC-F family ATP-binding cassette domain-containing protein [Clostridia bacterium]
MSILTIKGLSHVYDSKVLFKEADLVINNGEHCGIVGLNGAGKTTFMNIISGIVMHDEGEIKWLNGIRWGYLDQHADIDRSLTIMEYLMSSFDHLHQLNAKMEEMYEEMSTENDEEKLSQLVNRASAIMERLNEEDYYDLENKIKKVANGLGLGNLGYDSVIGKLSGGQRAKVILSRLLLENLDVMLLDEPTNFLDIEHIDWLRKFLDTFKGTFLLISHDVDFLNKVCKYVINIENKQIKKYSGTYDDFMSQYESNAKQYAETYERQQREIKKMEEYIAKNKARAATAGMANSRKKMLEKIDVMEKPISMAPANFNFPYAQLVTKDLLIAEKLLIGYEGKAILPEINIHMSSSAKLWIRGTNGLGKTTLLKTLMQLIPAIKGKFRFNINSKINYVEQDLNFHGEQSAIGYMNDIYPRMGQKEIRAQLAKVGIIKELSTRALSTLSGGEQVKVKLCAMMNKECNILILDEPTNHLDVVAKEALQEALIAYEGAIILVSHEIPFAKAVCNDILDLEF